MKICYFKTLSQLLLIPFLLIFLLIGCLPGEKTIPKTTYYTLAYDPPKFQDPKPLPDIIRVERFQAAPIYNSDRIVYSEDQFQREEYFYHKWRTKPVELVTYFLVRDMQASSLFKAVTNRNSKISPSYSVEGTVDDFFEKDQEKLWEAVLSVSIILLKENEQRISKKVLLQKKILRTEPVCQTKPAIPRGSDEPGHGTDI